MQHAAMSILDDLFRYWRDSETPLEPPASAKAILALERELGARLPSDLRLFYSISNGMPDCEYDPHEISFWSIEKMLGEWMESVEGTDERGPFRDLAFADFLINSSFWMLRTRNGEVSIYLQDTEEELRSLTNLAERYLGAPDSLPML